MKEYQYLVHLLKSFIHKEKPQKIEDIDWLRMEQIASVHSLSGILGYMVTEYKLTESKETVLRMRNCCMQSFYLYANRNRMMTELIAKLKQHDIDHILFKGFVLKDYYPQAELRSYGDIDFVIRTKDRDKCHQLMLENEFQVKQNWEPVYSYYKGYEYYEIHTEVIDVNISEAIDHKEYFRQMWEHVIQVGEHTWEFTPEYHFLYLLTHISKHVYGSGAGIRMYLDIAVFIQHYRKIVDWAWIMQELERLNLSVFGNVVFAAVQEWFAVDSPIEITSINKRIIEDLFLFTMEGGTYGNINRVNGVNTLRKENRKNEDVSKTKVLVRRLFPPADTIENRYTYLKNKHWLLPVAWIHRLFKTKAGWSMHLQEGKEILSADVNAVKNKNVFYKNIGL